MLPTPRTTHLSFDNIYEPSEDSFLFLDTLAQPSLISYHNIRFPPTSTPSPLITEVGTGSGVVLAFATAHAQFLFGRDDVCSLGIDVNAFACVGTSETVQYAVKDSQTENEGKQGQKAGIWLDAVNASLMSCLRPHSVDILLFNPPYVPSESVPVPSLPSSFQPEQNEAVLDRHKVFERDSNCLALATDGGADGMEVTNQLLEQVPEVLSERGVAYVLLCAQNRPEEVKRRIREWGEEWEVETVGDSGKKGGWEKLQIVRIARLVPGHEAIEENMSE